MYRAKKKFGQHFLNDQTVLSDIVNSANLKDDDIVWEIGPGLGSLTDHLLKHKIDLTIFEIDNDLAPSLQSNYSDRCKVVHKDILKVDWKKQTSGAFEKIKIVTNLPYQISSPFLYRLAENSTAFSLVVVMLQKEVAKRLSAKAGKKDYGVLTLKTQFYFDTEYLFDVSRDKFTPPPEVESAVIRLTPRKDRPDIENIGMFWELVEAAFRNRRKTLRNNLRYSGHAWIASGAHSEADCPIDLNRRGETLSERDFISLYDYLR